MGAVSISELVSGLGSSRKYDILRSCIILYSCIHIAVLLGNMHPAKHLVFRTPPDGPRAHSGYAWLRVSSAALCHRTTAKLDDLACKEREAR